MKALHDSMNSSTQIVIVGAGPYGLSLAAHLSERGVPFRIFGHPMQTWATQMPEGMKLKSDGFASNLSAGSREWTLQDFCRETGRLYHPTLHPVALEDFIAYGQEFARRFVPTLEPLNVTLIEPFAPAAPVTEPHGGGARRAKRGETGKRGPQTRCFRVTLEDGGSLLASEVVVAVGLSQFSHLPGELRHLPADMISHTADHRLFERFCSRDVTVLGRGASALNAAAMLNECGARTTLISRKSKLHIHMPARRKGRSLYQRLRHPSSPLGPSLRSWLATHLPLCFHALPRFLRRCLVYKHLGPAGGSSLRGRVKGQLPMLLGWSIRSAEMLSAGPADRHVLLTLVNEDGEVREHITSHIIAGTGFRVDVRRLAFLPRSVSCSLRLEENGAPTLDRHFGSSVPGLYFVGPAAAASFGPLLRFAAGARFAAGRLTAHLARNFARAGHRLPASSFESAPARERHAA